MKTIALITDFGTVDGFVGTMKGVIASIAPDATIIDISHESSPQHIEHAAFILWSSYRYFPDNTIFVVVVDPGVGSDRRIILVEDAGGKKFLVPENGVLRFVLPELNKPKAHHINKPEYWVSPVSSTFHGRDIFAPVAAHLSAGKRTDELGSAVDISIPPSQFRNIDRETQESEGSILHTDRFGNLITNFRADTDTSQELERFSIEIGEKTIQAMKKTYADGEYGELIAIVGSSGLIEIAVRNGSAQQLLGLRVGDPVIIRRNDT
jgi:S-adenosyl-L-methionine hydrolase (adenosine-forming)